MVFEPNFTKVVRSTRRNVGITQSVIELKLPTNESQILSIYSVSAKSTIVSSESMGREISFVGLVDFQAVFESNGVGAIDYSAEFRDKFISDNEIVGELIITSNVIDVTSSIAGDGIKVVAIVEVTIDEIASEDVNVLVGAEGDNVFLSSKEIEYSTYIGKAQEKTDVSGDISIRDAYKVLVVTPSICIGDVEPKDNYISVRGRLNVDICYMTSEDSNSIRSMTSDIDYAIEVAYDGVTDKSFVESVVSNVFNEIKVTTTPEEGGSLVSIYAPVVYTGYIFNQMTMEVVDDLYLQNNYLSITTESFESIKYSPSISFRDNISGVASISDTAPFIDEILGVCANNIVLASSRVEDGKLVIEGVANATVVYYTKETSNLTSVSVEMPFSVENKVVGESSCVVSLCLVDLTAKSKRGKEIEVSSELNVYADMYDTSSNMVISAVALGEEKSQDDCSLYIYIVKPNQTIWDIAKEMNVSSELILEQNPDVELPLNVGDRLVVYTPRIVEF